MPYTNPFQRTQTGGANNTPIACAITSPAAGASLTEGNVVVITGTITVSGTVVVRKGATTLGAAAVVGLAWSYSYTLVTGDVGSLTFNATATSVFGGPTADATGVTVTVAPLFTGNFGSLFSGYGLNVRAYFRADLGVSGTTGTGKTAWANQLGDVGNMGLGTGATNGIGTATAGLNGHAGISTNGTDQGGLYTFPSYVAPATTNHHVWAIERLLAVPAANGYMHATAGGGEVVYIGGTTSEVGLLNGGAGAITTGVTLTQWYRLRASFIGGLDRIRVGAHEPSPISTSNVLSNTGWTFGSGTTGLLRSSIETLCLMHVEGPIATFLTAAADADAKARTFWTTAIEI